MTYTFILLFFTGDEGCTNGFISHNNLVRKSLQLALETSYNMLYIVPDMKFPRSGNITKILFSGVFLDTTGSDTRTQYPELQVWQLQNPSDSGDTYRKIDAIGYTIAPEFSKHVNVYEFKLNSSLFVQKGDILGYYQPPSSDSVMGLVSIEDRGPYNYFLFGQNPNTVTLSSPYLGKCKRTPLVNFVYGELSRDHLHTV